MVKNLVRNDDSPRVCLVKNTLSKVFLLKVFLALKVFLGESPFLQKTQVIFQHYK